MEYQVLDPETIDPTPDRPCIHRAISSAAGLSAVAINEYEVEPGEQLPLAYHYHDEQEEVFYVLDGRLAVETPEGEFTVEADECFVAGPDSPHRAYSPGSATDPVRVLAIGAPPVDDVHRYEP